MSRGAPTKVSPKSHLSTYSTHFHPSSLLYSCFTPCCVSSLTETRNLRVRILVRQADIPLVWNIRNKVDIPPPVGVLPNVPKGTVYPDPSTGGRRIHPFGRDDLCMTVQGGAAFSGGEVQMYVSSAPYLPYHNPLSSPPSLPSDLIPHFLSYRSSLVVIFGREIGTNL